MAKKIGILLKVFKTEKFRDDFLNGILYMNTIDYFRNYEETEIANIADRHEAISNWLQPHEFSFEFEVNGVKHKLNPEDLAGPITMSWNIHNHANVYCMTQLHSHDLDMDNLTSLADLDLAKSYFTLPDEVSKLGDYMVIIANPTEFLSRVRTEAKRLYDNKLARWYSSKQVTYYDEINSSLILDNNLDAPFYKQSTFSHQSEYRICLIRDNPENKAYSLRIGSIRDIAMEAETKDFNSLIEWSKVEK